jgi:hypothetical protein
MSELLGVKVGDAHFLDLADFAKRLYRRQSRGIERFGGENSETVDRTRNS